MAEDVDVVTQMFIGDANYDDLERMVSSLGYGADVHVDNDATLRWAVRTGRLKMVILRPSFLS